MTLEDVYDSFGRDNPGIYALWVINNLPDMGEHTNVQGISHCTVVYSDRDGIQDPSPDWIDEFEPSEIKAQYLAFLDL